MMAKRKKKYLHRKRKKKKNSFPWVPFILALSIGMLFLSSALDKSPWRVISDTYYLIAGKPTPHPDRKSLLATISRKNAKIDSLSETIEKMLQKRTYRVARVSTTANALNLRESPHLTAPVVIQIPDSSQVEVLYFDNEVLVLDGQTGKWCKVKYADKEGWVWGNYLVLEN